MFQKRKSWQFQKACLNDWEVSIEIEKSQFCLDITFQSQKSWLRLWNLSRPEISQFVKIFESEVPQKVSIILRNLEKSWKASNKSWKVSTNLKNLDSLDLSRQSWWNSWHSLISILKILTKKKKSCLDSKNNLDKFQKLILTDQEFLISISIGLNCWDPHA